MTTRDDVLTWLAARRPAPPAQLAAHLAAVARGGSRPLPEMLAQTGVELLGRVAGAPAGGRELALDLLAADAYVTYAFEAQAEQGVDGLAALADRLKRNGEVS